MLKLVQDKFKQIFTEMHLQRLDEQLFDEVFELAAIKNETVKFMVETIDWETQALQTLSSDIYDTTLQVTQGLRKLKAIGIEELFA